MPARNEPCPCGSGAKFKRCCLLRLDAVARELRARDAVLKRIIDWVRDEHADALDEAHEDTMLVRMLRGPTGRSMSLIWALNDRRPRDGGPTLMARFLRSVELDPAETQIARGLAGARLDVFRVGAATGVTLDLESLTGAPPAELLIERGAENLTAGDILVARVVRTSAPATLWGLAARFDGTDERRWAARLASLPDDEVQAALMMLTFHPDDAAEPPPDGVELLSQTWSIHCEADVIEALEDDDDVECIGEAVPSGWAFAWIAECGYAPDLGGEIEGRPEYIEAARLIVEERQMTAISADRAALHALAEHVETRLSGLIAPEQMRVAA